MLIVLEGHDLSGKSTLLSEIDSLLDLLAFAPWADLSDPRPSLTSVSRTLLRVAEAHRGVLVVDRFITSELVYGKLAGRSVDYITELLGEWRHIGVIVLQLHTSESEMFARYQHRGDHAHDWEQLKQVRASYESLSLMLPEWVHHQSGTAEQMHAVLNNILAANARVSAFGEGQEEGQWIQSVRADE